MNARNLSKSSLREALQLLWSESDSYVRRRVAGAFVLVVAYSMLTALAPIAFAYLVDMFAESKRTEDFWAPALILGAYVLSQFLVRALSAVRDLLHGRGEQRLNRYLSRRLFSHIVRLPLRFHLERKTGAMGETP
jgi:ATP-binding cassette subfamily B protein